MTRRRTDRPSLMPVEIAALPNGVRGVLAPLPAVDSVSVGIWVGVGGRHETADRSGISHFIEHLVFKGTRHFSCRAIAQTIEGRGGYLNAFTQEENTCYYARVAGDQFGRAFDVLADMVRRPRLAAADIRRERSVIIEEIQMYRDQPAQWVDDLLGAAMWSDHPLGRPIAGSPESVAGIDRRRLVDFHRANYGAGNLVVAVAGAFDRDAVWRRLTAEFEDLPPAPAPRYAPVTRAVGQSGVEVRTREIEQAHLAVGVRVNFGRADRRRFLFKLLNVILGENMSSRLFVTLREREGLAYEIHSSSQLMGDTGSLEIAAGLDGERTVRAVRLIGRELRRLVREPVGPREFRRAQDYTVGQIRLGLESTSARMLWAGESLLTWGRVVTPEEAIEGIERATPGELQALASEILRPRRISLALVIPKNRPSAPAPYREALFS